MRVANLGGLTVRLTGGDDGSGGGDGPLVVLLHGFGAPADDLIPLGSVMSVPDGTRFAFPAAPVGLPAMFGPGRAWWMIDIGRFERVQGGDLSQLADEVPDGLAEARAHVMAMLDELPAAVGVAPERIALGGFSQGAMLSCDVALRSERPLAGVVLMSGVMLCRPEWLRLMPARKGLPVFQSHGREDPLLPFALARELRDAMSAAGLAVDWIEFRGGHEIPPQVLAGASEFLLRALSV
jgi:phospholipase/carboxylesterase